jgi:ATP-dependent helicase/nuclease subunit A
VCEARHDCEIDDLLVVTFTEEAAAEMRGRIEQTLRERLANADSERLRKQLALVERAQISTIHGFCAKVIREHFNLLGLDPGFTILDGDEAPLLQSEVVREMFADRYEHDESVAFHRLVDCYADGNDEQLVYRIIGAYSMLTSVRDPQRWREDAIARIAEASEKPLKESAMGREFIELIDHRLKSLKEIIERQANVIHRLRNFPEYVEQLRELYRVVAKHWQPAFESSGIDGLAEVVHDFETPKLPRYSNTTPGKDAAKAAIDAVRDEFDGDGSFAQMLRFDENQWRDGLKETLPFARLLLELVEEFEKRYEDAKLASRSLDFADLERLTLRLLMDPKTSTADKPAPTSVARMYHARFKHVLVDEYQDINEVQDAILTLVSRESAEKRFAPVAISRVASSTVPRQSAPKAGKKRGEDAPLFATLFDPPPQPPTAESPAVVVENAQPSLDHNLFCVGDVKQSIYGFRLADPKRFMDRYDRFKSTADKRSGEVVDLQANFRSRGPLLDTVNAVFERLMTRKSADISYDESQKLKANAEYPPHVGDDCFTGAPVELHLLPAKVDLSDASDNGNGIGGGEAPAEPLPSRAGNHGSAEASPSQSAPTTSNAAADLEQDRTLREATFVAKRIQQLMEMRVVDKDSGQLRPIGYGDIVVLLRSLQHKAEQFADVLRTHGIPVHADARGGFFESTEIRDMLALLSLLDNQRQDIPMAAALRSPLACIPSPDDALARIRLAYDSKENRVPFHEAATRYASEQDDELAARLRDFFATLKDWRDLAHRRPLAEVIWQIYDRSGFLAFCAGLADGEQRVANLIDLHERAAQFGTFQRQGLSRFLRFLESLRDETDLGRPSIASAADNVVRIMSVHRSKGLEFPIVILPDLGKGINLSSSQGSILLDRSAYLGMSVVDETRRIRYPSLAHVLVQTRLRREMVAEELRVLYVAMTRAKEHLILVGTCGENAVETWQSQWKSHNGAFPAEMVVGVRNMLDWVGPAAVNIEASKRGLFRITPHTSDEIASWIAPEAAASRGMTDRQKHLADLKPLKPPPRADAVAQDVIDRLSFAYPHRAIAEMSAATSVTTRTKKGKVAPAGYESDDAPTRPVDFGQVLRRPRFLAEDHPPLATDIGTATHLVLQHLDFSRACDALDLRNQFDELVARKLVKPAEARLIAAEGIEWLVNSEIGKLLRTHAKTLLRELPIFYALPSLQLETNQPIESDDPLDQIMIRGRLDVLIPTPAGYILIDYKTDRVTSETVQSRADFYRGQMDLYREAVEKITRRPVVAVHLAFLHPRLVQSLA